MKAVGWFDGERCWVAHDCVAGRVVTKLPNGFAKWRWDGQRVTPSFDCDDCGFHEWVETGEPEEAP